MTSKLIFMGLFLAVVSNAWAQGVVNIALPNAAQTVKKPANDLVAQDLTKDGQPLDVGAAAQLAENGFDLSNLNPIENKIWQNKVFSTSDAAQRKYPQANVGVQFPKSESAILGLAKFTSLHLVQSKENPKAYYRLAVSFQSQSMMMRAALLRKIGYPMNSPKYYRDLKVTFKDAKEKEKFLAQVAEDLGGIDLKARNWFHSDNAKDHSLVITSATLEEISNDVFEFYWGTAPNPNISNQVALTQRFSRYRAYRALIVPYVLVDVPESVNRFSTRFATVSAGYVGIPYYLAQSFQAATYEDVRWILKRIQRLTLKDFEEIVNESNYPAEIKPLVLAKLINRTRNAFELFQLGTNLPEQSLEINSSSGLVKAGKVTEMSVEGYPQHFAHGDRTSPFESGDMMRLFTLQGKSSVVESALSQLSQKLQVLTMQDALKDYQQDYFNRIINHIRTKPNEPFYREVTSWGGPLMGFNVNASRHVSTGTYTGSTAPVQLVDNVSIGLGLGMFRTIDGLEKYVPIAGANVSAVRDYTHVRPITSMKDASKVSWKSLMVPLHLKKISKVLETEGSTVKDGETITPVETFLNEMQDGEVFTVSDSVALSAYLQASASIDVLLGLTPFSFLNSVTLGADANRVIVKQVAFHRVMNERFNGVHVYVRKLKNKGKGLEMNANFYINLLKIRAQTQEADIKTDAFMVNLKAHNEDQLNKETEAGKKFEQRKADLRLALLGLFKDNSTELLYGNFQNQKFEAEHNLKAKETKIRFLAWRFQKFKEDHLVHLTPPRSEANPDLNPKNEVETLFSSKTGELKGRDIMGLGFDLIQGVIADKGMGQKLTISRKIGGDNPANAPSGKAYWRLVNTESHLTKNPKTAYPSVGMIQHTWGGWSMKKAEFLKTLAQIKQQFENTEIASYELMKPHELQNMNSLDFYRITANLSILGTGLNKIKDLLLQAQADAQNAKQNPGALKGLVKRLKCGDNQACVEKIQVANDKEFFNEILRLIGNGNLEQGRYAYDAMCREEKAKQQGEYAQNYNGAYLKGTYYECLSSWLASLIKLGHQYPSDKAQQTRWMTQVLSILEENIPLPQLLKFVGNENYIFLVRINGFRVGDEDGDLEYFSNTIGDPNKDYSYAGGLINLFVKKTGMLPTELDRTLGGFQ